MIINVRNIEANKAGVELKHTFTPKAINEGRPDGDKVRVVCRYFKSLQKMEYMKYDADKAIRYSIRDIFLGQVDEVKNLSIRDELGQVLVLKTASDVAELPSIPIIEGMMQEVVFHLLAGDDLTEDEEKNSESAISSSEGDSSTTN